MLMLLLIMALIVIPLGIGAALFVVKSRNQEEQAASLFCVPAFHKISVGDKVVYRKTKFSTHPGNRARDITASEHGENYTYFVDKYWVVTEVLGDGRVVARTRRGKLNYLRPDDPNLRKARLIEEVLHGSWFPKLAEAA